MAKPATTTVSAALLLICAAAFLAADAAGGRHQLTATAGGRRHLKDTFEGGHDLVFMACANVTRNARHHDYSGPGLTRDFCEITLWSDKRSASATQPRDLALLAMDLVREGAAAAGAKVGGIAAAKKTALSRDAALGLEYCRLDYEAVARAVPVCREIVQEYVRRDGEGPMIPYNYLQCTDRLVSAVFDCWGHIMYDDETKKTVWKEVSEVATRANLAKAMVENMLGVVAYFDNDGDDDDDDDQHHHRVVDDDDDEEVIHHHRGGRGDDNDD